MNGENEAMATMTTAVLDERPVAGWRFAFPLVSALIVAVLVIHRDTVESIVSIWWRSPTFVSRVD